MKKDVIKLMLGIIVIIGIVLIVASISQLTSRGNILNRIAEWPDVMIKTLDGAEISTGQFQSEKPILFNYFNSECIFCQAEIIDITDHNELVRSANLIFISDEKPEVIEKFLQHHRLNEHHRNLFLVDSEKILRDFYGIRSVPATYIYDADGQLVEFFRGMISAETIYLQIVQLNEGRK